MPDLEKNLHLVQCRITEAAERARRDPKEISLIAVSKAFPADAIAAAYALGLRQFGENRVEEAADKIPRVNTQLAANRSISPPDRPIWHLIGHLQSRKVKNAIPLFDYIHSVDGVEIAERIELCAAALNKTISIMLEVNTSGEETKFGFQLAAREKFFDAAQRILTFVHLNIVGLMTVAPIVQHPEDARPCFSSLRVLRDELQARHPEHPIPHLSMGMTDDFDIAIEEGATMIRIGRAIFGERK